MAEPKKKPTSKKSEEAQLEDAYANITRRKNQPAGKYAAQNPDGQTARKVTIIAISVTAAFLILLTVILVVTLGKNDSPQQNIPDLTVAGVNISGMSQEDAREAISTAAGSMYDDCSMEIHLGEYTIQLTAQDIQARLDLDSLMAGIENSSIQAGEFDITPYLVVNQEGILAAIEKQWEPIADQKTEPSWTLEGPAPDLTKDEAEIKCQTLVITLGAGHKDLDTQALYEEVVKNLAKGNFSIDFTYTTQEPEAPDLEAIHQELTTEPEDAQMDMETFEVSPHRYGYTFDLEAAQKQLEALGNEAVLKIPMVLTPPEKTTKDVEGLLFRDTLGTFTAKSGSIPGGRDVNLKLSCEALNGIVLKPGEVLAYNETLGERTPDKGWKPAASYEGTATVMTYGGGICQTSSALYYCALVADLEIVQRHSHTFISSYVPFGMDATVAWGGPDLKIKNNTEYPIRIEATANGGNVTVSLIGTDTKDYYIEMDYEIDWKEPYNTVYEEMTDQNPEGYLDGDVIISPYTGYKITTYKCKYDKQAKALISRDKEVTSIYSKRDQVICKIVEPETVPPTTQETIPSGPVQEDGA